MTIATPQISFSLSSARNVLTRRIVVFASLQNREPFYHRFEFPEFEGSDDLETIDRITSRRK